MKEIQELSFKLKEVLASKFFKVTVKSSYLYGNTVEITCFYDLTDRNNSLVVRDEVEHFRGTKDQVLQKVRCFTIR